MPTTNTARIDLYTDVTDRVVAELEKGVEAWAKSWSTCAGAWRPTNASTLKPYRGVNVLLCSFAQLERGYQRNRWITFRQALDLGGNVRRGAKGVRLVYWMALGRDKSDDKPEEKPAELDGCEELHTPTLLCRPFTVFNVAECEGLDTGSSADDSTAEPGPESSVADRIIDASGAIILEGEPSYYPGSDVIRMPPRAASHTLDAYHATALHELTHWTAPRVGRDASFKRWGDEAYAMEELCAELGAAMLCGAADVPAVSQCASYLASWLRVLKSDKRAIFSVAGQAQRAADFLLDRAGLLVHSPEAAA